MLLCDKSRTRIDSFLTWSTFNLLILLLLIVKVSKCFRLLRAWGSLFILHALISNSARLVQSNTSLGIFLIFMLYRPIRRIVSRLFDLIKSLYEQSYPLLNISFTT